MARLVDYAAMHPLPGTHNRGDQSFSISTDSTRSMHNLFAVNGVHMLWIIGKMAACSIFIIDDKQI